MMHAAHPSNPCVQLTVNLGNVMKRPRLKVVLIAATLLAVVYVLLLAWCTREEVMDDAYIGFRCIDNLLAGRGFVFNPAERVEGVTNSGWLLLITPLALLFPIPVAAKILTTILIVLSVILYTLTICKIRDPDAPPLAVLFLPLLLVALSSFVYFSLLCMETSLVSALIAVMCVFNIRCCRPLSTAGISALLCTVRPECLLLYPCLLLLDCGKKLSAWKSRLKGVVLFAGIIAGMTLARYAYYGNVLPNTFNAKSTTLLAAGFRGLDTLQGVNPNISVPLLGLAVLPFVISGYSTMRKRNLHVANILLSSLLVGLLFGSYARKDWSGMDRYFAPYAPAAIVLFWQGFVKVSRPVMENIVPAERVQRVLGLLAVTFALVGVTSTLIRMHPESTRQYPGYVLTTVPLVGPAKWIAEHLPRDATIATRRIGAVGYYSGNEIFDYAFGLIHKDVAGLIQHENRQFNLPSDAALASLWQRRAPEYILEDDHLIAELIGTVGGSEEHFVIHGIPYKICKRFPIGNNVNWVLCEQIELRASATE